MCVTLTIIGIATQAIGAFQQAAAAQQQARYQAQVQRNNAIIAARNAETVRLQGQREVEQRGQRTRQVIGAARAALASNGLLVDDSAQSTPSQLIDDLSRAGATDMVRIRRLTANEEQRALVQGMNFEAQAGLYDLRANSINPMFAAFTAATSGLMNNADLLFG